MHAREAVEALRSRLHETLRPLLASVERVALIDFPNTPNVGDSAIFLGELAALESLGVPRPRFICDLRTYDRAELARRLGPSGVILFAGGGSLGDVWPRAQELREDIIRSFPDHRIIQFPQTVHFERSDSLRRTRAALNGHRDITLLLRDARSLDIARNEFRAPSLLCPDVALALGALPPPVPATKRLLWLLRTDKEARGPMPERVSDVPVDWMEEPPMWLRTWSYRLITATRYKPLRGLARSILTRVYAPLARQRLRRGLTMLSSADVVITDRLHAHILCLLLGIPHVLLDNNYGKLSSFYETWTSDVDSVRWAESHSEALGLATELGRAVPPRAVLAESRRG
jgi:exopolysaccharide biosynthesis predicted pyruvyltransferase EpsI